MSSPFPGMEPYLENPELWAEVHNRLIVAMADAIESGLPSQYRVAIEKRVYRIGTKDVILVGIPDVTRSSSQPTAFQKSPEVTVASKCEPITVKIPMSFEVRESYLEIKEVATSEVITVIEILSPVNKHPGKGRQAYKRKRRQVLESFTHLIEIDLLRAGKPMLLLGEIPSSDYRILISREYQRPHAQLYAFSVRDEIPSFPLPLQPGEVEPIVELQALLDGIYKRARYHLTIDYRREPIPALKADDKANDKAWANTLLREKGFR
jgi:hypothetical protein